MAVDKPQSSNRTPRPLTTTFTTQSKLGQLPLTPRLATSTISPRFSVASRTTRSSPPKESPLTFSPTPAKSLLSLNITPRSGSRKARVESTNSTPSKPQDASIKGYTAKAATDSPITPNLSQANGSERRPVGGGGGGVTDGSVIDRRSSLSRRLSLERTHGRRPEPLKLSPTIFPANEAKTVLESPKSEAFGQASKEATFFYANGDRLEKEFASPSGSTVSSSIGGPRSTTTMRRSMNSHSPESRRPPGREGDFHSSHGPMLCSPRQVPHVTELPVKSHSLVSPVRHDGEGLTVVASPVVTEETTRTTASSLQSTGANDTGPKHALLGQILSEVAAVERGHRKSMSVGSLEHNAFRYRTSEHGSMTEAAVAASKRASFLEFDLPNTSEDHHTASVASDGGESGLAGSPTCRPHQADELAAKARRERKVLDLEISNSSLMAINRTLEKKMRKQNAELRRFRRLSRSGRLSLATTSSLGVNLSRPFSLGGIDELPDPSDHSEPESMFSPSDEDSLDDGSLSPGAMAESDARHRDQDEKRLRLDLAKHQGLLVDSHKLNESLKRCLGWTEDLISQGKKALDYRVRVSDIEFGGRVLVRDELDDSHIRHTAIAPAHPEEYHATVEGHDSLLDRQSLTTGSDEQANLTALETG